MSREIPKRMQVQTISEFGEPDVFTTTEQSVPIAECGEVLIRVEATSINPIDYKIRSGAAGTLVPEFPAVLHGDVAGVAVAVGDDVSRFTEGDEVYGFAGGLAGLDGALGEYMAADAELLAQKPESLSFEASAALPLVSITAWDGLIDRANLDGDQSVLVHGGTGGVGHVAVQLAADSEADVYATCSTRYKRDRAEALGARKAIDYRNESVDEYVESFTDGRGFDVVFDTVGDDNLPNSFEAAARRGTVVTTESSSEQPLGAVQEKGLTVGVINTLHPLLFGDGRLRYGDILESIANLVDEDRLTPLLDDTDFTVPNVADAHRRLESGDHVGKVTLTRP